MHAVQSSVIYFCFSDSDLNGADYAMIPCEFCDEAFPAELLFVHQVSSKNCKQLLLCVQDENSL